MLPGHVVPQQIPFYLYIESHHTKFANESYPALLTTSLIPTYVISHDINDISRNTHCELLVRTPYCAVFKKITN